MLVFGIEKMPKGIIRSSFFAPWQEAAGLNPAPAFFALRAQRLLAETGLTERPPGPGGGQEPPTRGGQPRRHVPKAVTVEEVLAARMICPPLTLFMLCSPNEGAAAVVLEGDGAGVRLAGISLRSHLPGSVLGEDSPLSGIDDSAITPPTTLAAQDAYAQAGVGPGDVDVVECQDTDAARELLAWAELGLCPPGEQAALLADGSVEVGGRLPVNPSGGLLSKGEPLGASALGQVVELVRQLRGQAGGRQVDGARVGLAHVIGRGRQRLRHRAGGMMRADPPPGPGPHRAGRALLLREPWPSSTSGCGDGCGASALRRGSTSAGTPWPAWPWGRGAWWPRS